MKPLKLYLISPREPSGATWLINCFLELGIKTWRETQGEMWEPSGQGGDTLNPVENYLKKWLPILSTRETFHFRNDIEVQWAHNWPTARYQAHRIIYFVRDPRDALQSRYRREAPDMTFGEFLDFPDPYTLHDKLDTWCLFNDVWLQQPDLKFFRFEDYKRDARRTLEDILSYAGIRVEERQLLAALENSTFEKAALAEKKYREQHPEDEELINRASQVGAWQSADDAGDAARIAERAQGLLAHYGYESKSKTVAKSYLPQAGALDFYKRLPVRPGFWREESDPMAVAANTARIEQFMMALDDDRLNRSGLSPYEIFVLLQGLEEFTRRTGSPHVLKIRLLRHHRVIKPWWRIIRAMDRFDLRFPGSVRVLLWRFRKFMFDDKT